MSGFVITREALIAAAGCDPYELQEEFELDTDPEMVGTLASIFKNGAEEAQDSGSVADYASSLEESAGSRGGNAIYEDGAAHLEQTYADLGEAGLRTVSNTLGEIREEMETLRTYLSDSIDGEIGLEYWREWYAGQARQEIEAALDPLADKPGDEMYRVAVHGQEWTATASTFPSGEVRSFIEKEYTDRAGEYAADVHDRMKTELDDYYAFLSNREERLSEEGYDTGESPVNLWYSPGRAEYEAEQLKLELEKPEPDPVAIARYTAGLENVLNGMLDDSGRLLPDADQLSDEELAFLTGFYDTLGQDALLAMGTLGHDPMRDGPAAVESITDAQRALANGINVMTNPSVGGLDTHMPDQFAELPRSIASLLEDPDATVTLPFQDQLDHYEKFDAFGDLMGHATAPAGSGFSQDLGYAALWAQEGLNGLGNQAGAGTVDMSGASGALRSVALNDSASATLINDDFFRGRMLNAAWEDSGGAGEVIRSATLPSEDGELRPVQERAAFALLTDVAQNRETLGVIGENENADMAGIQSAVADVTLGYLDHLSETSVGSEEPSHLGADGDGFLLSANDRQDLFQYIADTPQEVVNTFETGLGQYYYAKADEAFDSTATPAQQRVILENLGAIEGAVTGGFHQALVDEQKSEDQKEELQAKLAIAGLTAATGVGGAVAAPGAAATSWALAGAGVGSVGGLVKTNPDAPGLADDLNYQADMHGDWSLRQQVAQAALDQDYGTTDRDLRDLYGDDSPYVGEDGRPRMPGETVGDLGDALTAAETSYESAAGVMTDAYEEHRRDASAN